MNRTFPGMNGQRAAVRGFTLIELLVTLAIITIVVSVGIPMYGSFTRDSALSGASSNLAGAIQEARSRAVAERTAVNLTRINTGALAAGVWSAGWEITRASDGVLLQRVDVTGGNVNIIEANGINQAVFDREGRSTPALSFQIFPVNVMAADPGRQIDVSAFGRTTVQRIYHP